MVSRSYPLERHLFFLQSRILNCLFGASLTGAFCLAQTTAIRDRGAVVQEVEKNSAGEAAGLRSGDLIQGWSASTGEGAIDSPFDLVDIGTEQGPRGPVMLRGWSGGHEQTWSLSLRPRGWGITSSPSLAGNVLALYQESQALTKAGKPGDTAERLRSAATQVNASDPPWLAAWLLTEAGSTQAKVRAWSQTDELFKAALDRSVDCGAAVRMQVLQLWASFFYERGDWVNAEKYFQQSIAEIRNLQTESLAIARSLSYLGLIARRLDDWKKARDYHLQSLSMREKLAPGSLDVADSLNDLGFVFSSQGDAENAERYYRQALSFSRNIAPDSSKVATSLNNLGAIASKRGDLIQAEDYFAQALELRQKIAPESLDIVPALNNIGVVTWRRGDLVKAESYYRQGLDIQERLAPGSLDSTVLLNNLGTVWRNRGELDKAEEYHLRALAITEEFAPGGVESAKALNMLGLVTRDRGDLTAAESYYQRALAIRQKLTPGTLEMSASLHNLGVVAFKRGDLDRASEYLRQALAIREKLAPGHVESAETSYALGLVQRSSGKLPDASKSFARALDVLEQQTGRLGGTEQNRSGFRAQYAPFYRDDIDLLLTKGEDAEAFHVAERSLARSLLAMLAERDLVPSSDVAPEIREARKTNAITYDRVQAQIARTSQSKQRAQLETLLSDLQKLAVEREEIAERIRRASPRFASLQYPQPLDLAGARHVLDPGDVLLSYSVGENSTVLFVVQPPKVGPGLAVFKIPIGEKDLQSQVQSFRRLIEQRDASDRAALNDRARVLYNLLVKPAEGQLAASERLLIVPDGPLHFLPFAALLRGDNKYLVEWKPIHSIVSMTVYAEVKKLRDAGTHTSVELIAFGDPQFPDMRVSRQESKASPQMRSALENGFTLARLPFSREEVNNIASLYPRRSEVYLGPVATEENAKATMPKARYLHFAVHGFLDERFPLDSAIVLTIPKLIEGHDNGLLQAWEIFEQVRINADLVVLSGCQTGLGVELTGEGLIGLTRAFQYAGAHSIIASLWNVDDRRTADLMKRLYARLLSGMSKDEALRTAQLDLIHSQAGSHPFYWAAFSLIGDWQ